MVDDNKELGLGVLFTASIKGFTEQLTDVQNKLKTFAKQIESFGKTSEKAVQGLTKVTSAAEKAAEKSAKTIADSEKKSKEAVEKHAKTLKDLKSTTEKVTGVNKVHGKTLADVRSELDGLSASTQAHVANSKMSLPVYEALEKQLKKNSTESLGFKNALGKLASEEGQTVLGFNNLASALTKNEKTILETKKGFDSLRKTIGPDGIPSDLRVWSRDLNRVELAHATLRGELGISKGVVIQAGKDITATQRALNALENQFGKSNVSKYKEQIGSSIKTMSEFKSALVANQKEQIALNTHTIAAEKAIRSTENAMNAMVSGSGTKWRNGINESAVATEFLKGNLVKANGVVLDAGKNFVTTSKAVEKMGSSFKGSLSPETFTAITNQVGKSITSINEYGTALEKSVRRSSELQKQNSLTGKALHDLSGNTIASSSAISYLSDKVASGTMSFKTASNILKQHSNRITDLKTANEGLAAQTAILTNRYSDLLGPTSKYREEATRLLSTMEAGKTSMTITSDNMKKLYATYVDNEKGIKSWNNAVESFSTSSEKMKTKIGSLQTLIDSGTISHKHGAESLNKYAKSIGESSTRAAAAHSSMKSLTQGIMGGGAAANLATNYITRLSVAVRSLSAWTIGAMVIGGFTAAIGSAISAVVQYDQGLKNLQAISGGTDAEVKALGEEMLRLSDSTKYSSAEIAKGSIYIAQAGFTASETMQVIGAAAKLAQGTMSEMGTSTDLLTTILRVFQIDARQSSMVVDKLAIAANKSKTDIEGLKVAFNYLGPVSKAAGLSLDEALASIMALANAGIKMSTIGTSMRQVISRLENPTAKLRDAMREAGLSIEDFNFKTHSLGQVAENMSKIVKGDAGNALKLFGERAGNAALVVSSLGVHMDTMVGFMSEMGAASQMAAKQTEGLGVKLSVLRNHYQNLVIKFAESELLSIVKGIVTGLTAFVDVLGVLVNNAFARFLAVATLVTVSLKGIQIAVQGLVILNLAGWLNISREAITAAISHMGFWNTAIGTVVSSFRILIATGLASWIGVSVEAILTTVKTMGIWNTITGVLTASTFTLSGALAVLRAALIGLATSFSTYVIILTGIIIWLIKSKDAHQKETDAIVNKSAKLKDSSIALKDYENDLKNMSESQKKGNDVHLQNVALLQKIRTEYPKISSEILNSKMTIDQQAQAVARLSQEYEANSLAQGKIAVTRLTKEMQEASKTAASYQKYIDENTSALSAFFDIFVPGKEKMVAFKTVLYGLAGTFVDSMDKTNMWANSLGSNFVTIGQRAETLGLNIAKYAPETRENMLKMIPSEELRKRVESYIVMSDKLQSLLKAQTTFTEEMKKTGQSALEKLGDAWVEYFNKQDALGARDVITTAAQSAKKIALKEKELEKYKDDANKVAEIQAEIFKIQEEDLQKLKEKREKLFEEMLKLLDNFYKKEEESIKAASENQRRILEIERDDKLNNLNLEFKDEQNYLVKKQNIEEEFLNKTKIIIDAEATASVNSAKYAFDKKKEFIDKQKLLVDDETVRQKLLTNEQNLSSKLVDIYKNQLAQYKTIMDQKRGEIEKYRQAAIKAEEDIAKAIKDNLKVIQDVEEMKRSARQLTMNDQEKAKDDNEAFNELLRKGSQAAYEASQAAIAGDKIKYEEMKSVAKDYFDSAKGMISSLQVMEEDKEKKTAEAVKQANADKKNSDADYLNNLRGLSSSEAENLKTTYKMNLTATKDLRINAANEYKNAIGDLTNTIINFNKQEIDKNKELATQKQEQFSTLKTAYMDIQSLYEKAIVINMDNSKAVEQINELKTKIMSEPFEVVVHFYGQASPKDTLDSTISGIISRLTNFSSDLKTKSAEFIVNFFGTTTVLTERLPLGALIEKIKTDFINLTTAVQAIVPPSVTIWFWGDDGSIKDRLAKMYDKVKTDLNNLVLTINSLVSKFIIWFRSDSGRTITDEVNNIFSQIQSLSNKINSLRTVHTIVTKYVTEGSSGDSSGDSSSGSSNSISTSSSESFADGGIVPGTGTGDTVPAMLTPGELVVPVPLVPTVASFVDKLKGFSLPKFNMGGIVQSFKTGGIVNPESTTTFNLNLSIGDKTIPLKVIGNPNTMRSSIKQIERELSKMRLSRA